VAALAAAVLALNLWVWGAHALFPWRLAADAAEPRHRRLWSAAALPALGLSLAATLVALRLDPDPAVAWGLSGFLDGAPVARVLAILAASSALVDGVLLVGAERLEPRGWRIAGAVGVAGLAAATFGSELLRIGWGPVPGPLALYAAAALRLPLALAAAELSVGAPRLWSALAGPGLAGAFLLWPAALRRALALDLLTLGAAVALLVAARFVPARWRRAAGVAGLVLAVLFLARAGTLSAILGGGDQLPVELLGR
jgi:hypothetical protein